MNMAATMAAAWARRALIATIPFGSILDYSFGLLRLCRTCCSRGITVTNLQDCSMRRGLYSPAAKRCMKCCTAKGSQREIMGSISSVS